MTLPGLQGMDHAGFTVPDIEAAHDFFVEVLGCEHVGSVPLEQWSEQWLLEHMGVGPGAEITAIRNYRAPAGSTFEVFEYAAEGQRTEAPRNSDIGGNHIAFRVTDMTAAVAYLRDQGLRVLGDPSPAGDDGASWVYFLAPWGMQLELVSSGR